MILFQSTSACSITSSLLFQALDTCQLVVEFSTVSYIPVTKHILQRFWLHCAVILDIIVLTSAGLSDSSFLSLCLAQFVSFLRLRFIEDYNNTRILSMLLSSAAQIDPLTL